MQHLFEAQQLDPDIIRQLFSLADELEAKREPRLKGKVMASLFYEPSTRTRLSFESAMHRLGGGVIGTENAASFSSAAKGESLEDSIQVISMYADVIVLRYFEKDIAKRLAKILSVPVINAGDGAGQHPTQALLDLYTIKRELGRMDDISIAMVGDPKYSRSVRSLVYLLGKYKNISVHFVSAPELRPEPDILAYLDRHNIRYEQHDALDAVITKVDVIYRNRLQKERFPNEDLYKRCIDRITINREVASSMKNGAILMDPLPRDAALSPDVDDLPQAVYFKQPYYGLLVRMALLAYFLEK